MTPDELGDSVAHMVWETFTDFLDQEEPSFSLHDLGVETDAGVPPGHLVEEALIFFLWAHTRGTQLAFVGRASDRALRAGLDALHRAVFDDMVRAGTPESHVPLFEQHVSARYAEYNQAAAKSDTELSRVALRHLTGRDGEEAHAALILERVLAVAAPLRDFLAEVELREQPPA
jgi:hypothetical protein